MGSSELSAHPGHERCQASATCWLDIYGCRFIQRFTLNSLTILKHDDRRYICLYGIKYCCVHCTPVADGDQEVFGSGTEELKVSDVQLLQLNGLTELNDKPVGGTKNEKEV